MSRMLIEILADLEARTYRKSNKYYKPLESEYERDLVYDYYKCTLPDFKVPICNKAGTIIATDFTCIVTGDYGPYVEIAPDQIVGENIEPKWSMVPDRAVKYIWMQTKDDLKTKIYYQKRRVVYADYLPEHYYIDPKLLI